MIEGDVFTLVILTFGFGIFALIVGFKAMHKHSLISDIPRSKIRSIAMGIVEIYATIAKNKFIQTPLSKSKCVYYRLEVKEYRQHSSGKRTYYSWDTIHSYSELSPFYAQDETGKVLINPERADFDLPPKKVFLLKRGFFTASKTLFGLFTKINNVSKEIDQIKSDSDRHDEIQKQVNKDILNFDNKNLVALEVAKDFYLGMSVGDRKYYEYYLEPDEAVYIMGTAVNDRKEVNNMVIKKGENDETFLISTKNEEELLKTLKKNMIRGFVLGSILIVVGTAVVLFYFKIGL